MYCRRCGRRLAEGECRCGACGTEVVEVAQRPYAQRYAEERARERAEARASQAPAEVPAGVGLVRNRLVLPSLALGTLSLVMAFFPWPSSWQVGTSLAMRLAVLASGVAALGCSLAATRVESANQARVRRWNGGHKRRQVAYSFPLALRVAQVLAVLGAALGFCSLFMGG